MTAGQIQPQLAQFAGLPLQVASAVQAASASSGVDFAYLVTKAAVESSFDPAAKAANSTATGLYQFTESTWLEMVEAHGHKHGLEREATALSKGTLSATERREILDLRTDPKTSALMAAAYAGDNRAHLERSVGGPVGETELYLAHFLGPGGASTFLKAFRDDPTQPAAPLLPNAAKANQSVFYRNGQSRSLQDIYDRFADKFAGNREIPPGLADSLGLAPAKPGAVTPPFAKAGWLSAPMHLPASLGAASLGPGLAGALGASSWLSAPMPRSPLAFNSQLFLSSLEVPGEKTERGSP